MEQMIDVVAKMQRNEHLTKQLNNLPYSLAKKIMRKAARKAAKPLLDAARSFAPVKTGKLRKGIKIRAIKRKRSSLVVGVKVQTPTREELGIPEDAAHYYPAVMEYGSANIPARSYMRNAKDASEGEVFKIYQVEIQKLINEEAAKILMQTMKQSKAA